MAFNGSGTTSGANASSSGSSGNSGNQDGPLNKRLCTGKENNESGVNSNRVSYLFIYLLRPRQDLAEYYCRKNESKLFHEKPLSFQFYNF